LSAVTCVVAEIPGKVSRIDPVGPDTVRAQIEVVMKSFPVGAIKTGLLCTRANISAVAQSIADLKFRGPVVVDPVITATGGDSLLDSDAIKAYEQELFPLASLITPNLDEASQLLGQKIGDPESMERAGRQLKEKFKAALLLKGGHLEGDNALDLLFSDGRMAEFSAPFVRGVATHGTGCTYSAAITAELAKGASLTEAIERAKEFVTQCISNRLRWSGPNGHIDALRHDPSR
jgi:hydroxymethylpyrimidine/phosphomethylpyrimidine kinase